MNTYKAEVFLSYCWKNDDIANMIEQHFKPLGYVNIHMDKIAIGSWRSIKEYMHSISQMDFIILLISKEYLESSNCMYEILEVMRDRDYSSKQLSSNTGRSS
ncbi:MAG: toll/interleukin-1 receptor domain-containing protein [Cellulosilyticaceae bacterium]